MFKLNFSKVREKKIFKYSLAIFLCNLFRFFTFIPNADPIMGTMLPFARKDNGLSAALFAFLTMFIFDIVSGRFGVWTLVTATTYGLIGFLFGKALPYFKKINIFTYLASGVVGVLIFDFITGPLMSTFLFNQGFIETIILQIPFTLMHLASVSIFILIITPLIDVTIINYGQKNITLKKIYLGFLNKY